MGGSLFCSQGGVKIFMVERQYTFIRTIADSADVQE